MVSHFQQTLESLQKTPHTWLITGVGGFIGSHLLEALLKLNQRVVGIDNFSTGNPENLKQVQREILAEQWKNFLFLEGDIRNLEDCRRALTFSSSEQGSFPVEYVLHEAALGSVPRSINDPITTNATNIDGFLNMLVASRDAEVKRFVYAASSSTYGDHPGLPKIESIIGKPLSPYAVTKYVNELYADVFGRVYGLQCVGLRYFNVFGPRQNPNGAYAAVIPRWFSSLIQKEAIHINGDGETSRDFCYVKNVVQANILASCAKNAEAIGQVFNVAAGNRTSLNQLFLQIRALVSASVPEAGSIDPSYRDFRAGDVKHSLADISKAATLLGYQPSHQILEGLQESAPWYLTSSS